MLVGAVVVGGDAAGAEVDPLAHRGVAQIGQVIGLGAVGERRVLHLDEVADVHFGAQHGTGAQAGKRADERARPDAHAQRVAVDVGERVDHRVVGDRRVADHAVGADAHPVAQAHRAFKDAVDVNRHIDTALQFTAHIQPRRIGQPHADVHQRVGAVTLQQALERGELLRAVDAQHLGGAARLRGHHSHAIGHRMGHHIGQVVLALGVAVVQPRQPLLELRGGRGHGAGVDLVDGALLGRGVLVLDDGSDGRWQSCRGCCAHDAPVAAGINQVHRQ